jgi:hypothetical protein
MAKKSKKKEDDVGGIFVPAGLLIGLGVGFLYGNIPAGLFIGLGVGFALMAITKLMKKK